MAYRDIVNTTTVDRISGNFGTFVSTLTFAATATSGNLLTLIYRGNGSATQPTGWLVASTAEDTASSLITTLYYKVSDGSETSVDVQQSVSGGWWAQYTEYEGPWAASPLDVSSSQSNAPTFDGSLDLGPLTPTLTGTLAIAVASHQNGAAIVNSIDESYTIDEQHFGNAGGSGASFIAHKNLGAIAETSPTVTWGGTPKAVGLLSVFGQTGTPTASLDDINAGNPIDFGDTGIIANVSNILDENTLTLTIGDVPMLITDPVTGQTDATQYIQPLVVTPPSDSFTENFSATPLVAPWYDELAYTQSTNPDDASNGYSMTWGVGETGQNSGSTMRRLFEASDTFEIKFKFWCTAGFSGDNHMLHVLSSDAPIYAGSTAPYLINQIKVIDGNLRVNPASADRSPWPEYNTTGLSLNDGNVHELVVQCTLNDVGQANGTVKAFADDVQVLDITDMQVRESAGEQWGQFYIGPYLHAADSVSKTFNLDDLVVTNAETYTIPSTPPVQGGSAALTQGWWSSVNEPTAERYVSTSGNNGNDGLTLGTAWADIDYAATTVAGYTNSGAGTRINIEAGTYTNQDNAQSSEGGGINPGRGTATDPIWYQAYQAGNVVIDASGLRSGFNIDQYGIAGNPGGGSTYQRYIILDGLTIHGASHGGVYIHNEYSNSEQIGYVAIINSEIYGISGGGGTNPGGVKIEEDYSDGVYVANTLIHDIDVGGSQSQENGAGVHSYGMKNTVVEYCEFYNLADAVYHKAPNAAASVGNNVIRKNYIHDHNRSALQLNHSDTAGRPYGHHNNTFEYNLVVGGNSIDDDSSHSTFDQSSGLNINNNTFVDSKFIEMKGIDDVHNHSNIFYGVTDPLNTSDSQAPAIRTWSNGTQVTEIVESDYNCAYPAFNVRLNHYSSPTNYEGLTAWQAVTNAANTLGVSNPDGNSVEGDPLFENYAGGDYLLASGSPCIGTGKGGENMGAYESDTAVVGLLPQRINLLAAAEFPYDSSRSIAAQPKYVAATGGSDTTGDGSIGSPWATINASLPKLVAGDTLYLRGGTHSVSSYNFRFNVNDGTAGNYITVTSYPSEEPIIDCGGSSWINMDLTDYWQFTHLKVVDYVTAFDCAENAPYPLSPKFISIEGETAYGGDNVGLIKLRGGNDYEVDKVKVSLTVDPSTVHQNTGGIYIIDSSGVGTGSINRLETYDFRSGIYYKHGAGDLASNTQHITVSNSAFFGSTRTAVGYNCEGVLFDNCIFGTGLRLAEADGGEAGDWNWFDHCTFLGRPYLSSQNQSAQAGAKNNKFTDCIFDAGLRVGQLGSVTSDSDYNLFTPSSIEHTFIESPQSSVSVDLAGWRTFNSSDANSVEGTPTFVGAGDVIANYALQTGSAGENAASDGSDIGADVTLIGALA